MTSHTPGPWESQVEYDRIIGIQNAIGSEVMTAKDYGEGNIEIEVAPDDLHLILAAPDLLEACERTLNTILSRRDGDDDGGLDWTTRIITASRSLRDAIAKAKGAKS